MQKNTTPCYYRDYLKLPQLLSSQEPLSQQIGEPAHDEMLFIIVHQAYELWFKQILHELRSVSALFNQITVDDRALATVVHRLERVTTIQQLFLQQLDVLETMTPLDFLDFRDYLVPASGFQSIQFREIEILFGLKRHQNKGDESVVYGRLQADDQAYLIACEQKPSLFEGVHQWLARMPFLKFEGFDFWQAYQTAVQRMLEQDEQTIQQNPSLSPTLQQQQLRELANTRKQFEQLFDPEQFALLQQQGHMQFSQQAVLSALFINLYRDEPMLQLPFRVLTAFVEIDELFRLWKHRHAIMVHRMIGYKIGTGGSSGHEYLKRSLEKHRFFHDLFQLSTFLIPRKALPKLPDNLLKALGFYFAKN